MKLINGHRYSITETQNTFTFVLCNRKGTRLLWHSCSKNCKDAGEVSFWRKVVILYEQLEIKRSTLLNRNLNSLFAEIDTVEIQVAAIYTQAGNTDFLTKIDRVVLAL